MNIVLIGTYQALPQMLEEQGHTVQLLADHIPSLTALLLEWPDITSIAITGAAAQRWSLGHILAAAKALQGRGRMVLVGPGPELAQSLHASPLVILAEDETEAAKILLRPKGGAAAQAAAPKKAGAGGNGAAPQQEQEPSFKPMKISQGKILMIDVVGTQPRVGATTQAIALWHYLKALGLTPAVVISEAQLQLLARTMSGAKRDGDECVIDKVRFVPDTQRHYDCYIRDMGFGSRVDHRQADAVVIVAGVKPWELSNTIQAMHQAVPGKTAMLLSFATEQSRVELSNVWKDIPMAAAPFMPDPWTAGAAVLLILEKLLRPILEHSLEHSEEMEETQCLENEVHEILS